MLAPLLWWCRCWGQRGPAGEVGGCCVWRGAGLFVSSSRCCRCQSAPIVSDGTVSLGGPRREILVGNRVLAGGALGCFTAWVCAGGHSNSVSLQAEVCTTAARTLRRSGLLPEP